MLERCLQSAACTCAVGSGKMSTFSLYKRPLKMTQLKEDGGGGGGDPFTQGRILHMNRAKIRVCLTFCTGWLNSLIPHQLKLKTTISFSSIMDDLNCDSTFVCLFVCLFALCYFFFFCKPPDNRHPRFNSAMIIITCRRFHDYQVDEI